MPEYQKHLYMIVFPVNALVASQLDPEQFAEHYTIGSSKHYEGKVIFAEIDINFRDPYFEIDKYLAQTVTLSTGAPKKTKFISSYGVLEHVDLKSIKSLYLVTTNGKALELKSKDYTAVNEPGLVRIYQEITPLSNLVASTLDQRSFGKYLTMETKAKGAPKVFFTQYDFDVAQFTRRNENREILESSIPETNPTRLLYYITELKNDPAKKTKTISLNTTLQAASYRLLRHGFWFSAPNELLFFPMPTIAELERDHYDWWRCTH